jgi:VCBS repeat-containing protein
MPIKLFQDGEILNADAVNTYFMGQALVIFDDAAQRDAAFGEALEPGLSEGRICYLKSDDTIYIYTGAAWTAQLANIANGAITTVRLDGTAGSEAVTTAKIRDLNVTEGKIAAGAVTSGKLGTDLTLSGTTKIDEIFETATIVAAQPVASNGATLTLTITSGAVYYYTVATSHNIVLDIVTTGLVSGQAATVLLMVTSGATTGKLTSITVNGAANTPKWFGGNAFPNGNVAVDAYTITVFRNSSTYTVFASQSKFA